MNVLDKFLDAIKPVSYTHLTINNRRVFAQEDKNDK